MATVSDTKLVQVVRHFESQNELKCHTPSSDITHRHIEEGKYECLMDGECYLSL